MSAKGAALAAAVAFALWWLFRKKGDDCPCGGTQAQPADAPPQLGRRTPDMAALPTPSGPPAFVPTNAAVTAPSPPAPSAVDLCAAAGGSWLWEPDRGGYCQLPMPSSPAAPVPQSDYSGVRRQQCDATGGLYQNYPDWMGGPQCFHIGNGPPATKPVLILE